MPLSIEQAAAAQKRAAENNDNDDDDPPEDYYVLNAALLLMSMAVGHDQKRMLVMLGSMTETVLNECKDEAERVARSINYLDILAEHLGVEEAEADATDD